MTLLMQPLFAKLDPYGPPASSAPKTSLFTNFWNKILEKSSTGFNWKDIFSRFSSDNSLLNRVNQILQTSSPYILLIDSVKGPSSSRIILASRKKYQKSFIKDENSPENLYEEYSLKEYSFNDMKQFKEMQNLLTQNHSTNPNIYEYREDQLYIPHMLQVLNLPEGRISLDSYGPNNETTLTIKWDLLGKKKREIKITNARLAKALEIWLECKRQESNIFKNKINVDYVYPK